MSDTKNTTDTIAGLSAEKRQLLTGIYHKPGLPEELDEDEARFAIEQIEQINADLVIRETPTDVSNGIAYSEAYLYNRRKGINYSPPKNPEDDREVSLGIVHEKIVTFCAVFLKYVWKRRIQCHDQNGRKIPGLGEILDLAVEHSYKLEKFIRLMLLIFWEVFTQGDAFVLEDWQVRLVPNRKAFMMKDGEKVEVTEENMDFTLEFLEGLTYEEAKPTQTRMARSVLLDGRSVILGNPELEELQDQPRLTIEVQFGREEAQQLFGSLNRWKDVPITHESITALTGDTETLFNVSRLKDAGETVFAHYVYNKFANTSNLYLNGLMMLPRQTTMSIFYPRKNYPLTKISGERLKGSAYSRSIPAKTKFNADFVDWTLKALATKFEQGIFPAILAKGKYTLTRKMFRGGQVTHGVSSDDYERADPENKGVTQAEFSFTEMMKEIVESQTLNPGASGELSNNATATEIATTESNQRDKLGFLLDGLVLGMMDMVERRIETIESKYMLKNRVTIVDGEEVNVFQNFSVTAYGKENHVIMDNKVGVEGGYQAQGIADKLLEMSHKDQEDRGISSKYHLVNPDFIRERKYTSFVEILPDRRKDSGLQMIQMWDEFENLIATFQGGVNMDKLKEEYLEVSGRPEDIFNSADMQKLEEMRNAQELAGQQNGQPPASPAPPRAPKPTPQMLQTQK